MNTSGYTLNNAPVSVSGLGGAVVKFSSDGKEAESLDGSSPLVGEVSGRQLSINIGGSFTFRIHADNGKYTETGVKRQLPTTATLDGVPITYSSAYAPGSGSYDCSTSKLVMVTNDSVQTTTLLRG